MKSKNEKTLQSFIDYCKAHPEQRFWQALRNWSPFSFIYGGGQFVEHPALQDTFYLETEDTIISFQKK